MKFLNIPMEDMEMERLKKLKRQTQTKSYHELIMYLIKFYNQKGGGSDAVR